MTASSSRPEVSVIVPVHDARTVLPALLAALAAQTAPRATFEVLVVDDASTDGTGDVAARSGLARVVRAPSRGGAYAARNLGIAAARAPVLAFTDADCRPAPDWVERGLRAIAGVGLVAGRVDMPLAPDASPFALVDAARCLDQERYAASGHAATANLWVRREVLERIGLFCADLRSGGDTELTLRATEAGENLRYAADVRVVHEPRESAGALASKAFRLGFGAAQHRRYAAGSLRERPRYWAHPRSWLPEPGVTGLGRLEAAGHRPRGRRLMAVKAAQYACVRLPFAAGNLAGAIGTAAGLAQPPGGVRQPVGGHS